MQAICSLPAADRRRGRRGGAGSERRDACLSGIEKALVHAARYRVPHCVEYSVSAHGRWRGTGLEHPLPVTRRCHPPVYRAAGHELFLERMVFLPAVIPGCLCLAAGPHFRHFLDDPQFFPVGSYGGFPANSLSAVVLLRRRAEPRYFPSELNRLHPVPCSPYRGPILLRKYYFIFVHFVCFSFLFSF